MNWLVLTNTLWIFIVSGLGFKYQTKLERIFRKRQSTNARCFSDYYNSIYVMSAEELCECEYDEIRLKNIRERRALFQELGIEDAKAECKKGKKGISKTSKRSYTEETPTERTRKSIRIAENTRDKDTIGINHGMS